MDFEDDVCSSYSQFACIGSGFSAIGLGATLKRWYGISDVQFFERDDNLGGTWYANSYPGNSRRTPILAPLPPHPYPLADESAPS